MKNYYTDVNGNTMSWETPDIILPLNEFGALATLMVVLGLVPLEDMSNATKIPMNELVHEAISWYVAQHSQNITIETYEEPLENNEDIENMNTEDFAITNPEVDNAN